MVRAAKQLLTCIVIALLLWATASASADDPNKTAPVPYTLPEDIARVFDTEQWAAYQVVFPTGCFLDSGYASGAFYPVIMQKDGVNVLCVLEKQEGVWRVAFANETALYPGDMLPQSLDYHCSLPSEIYKPPYLESFSIGYTFDSPIDNMTGVSYQYAVYNDIWKLRLVQVWHPETPGSYVGGLDYHETNIVPYEGGLVYSTVLNEKDVLPDRARADTISVRLEDIDICAFPLVY